MSVVLDDLTVACYLIRERSDIQSAIYTDSAAQAAASILAHREDVSTPLCNHFDDSRNRVADGGVSVKSQESRDVQPTQIESVPAEITGAAPLGVQNNCGDTGIAT